MSEGYGSRWDAKQERKDSAQSTKNEVPQWMHEAAKEIGGMLSRRNEFHLMGVDVKEASRIIARHAPQLPADRESDSPTQILPRGEQTSYNCQPEVAAPPSKPDAEGKWPRHAAYKTNGTANYVVEQASEGGAWCIIQRGPPIPLIGEAPHLPWHAKDGERLLRSGEWVETDAAGNALKQPIGGEGAKVERFYALREVQNEPGILPTILRKRCGLVVKAADYDAAIASNDARIERLIAEINDLQKERTDTEIKNDAAIAAKDSVIERAKRGIVSLREQYASVSELLREIDQALSATRGV